MAHPSEARYRLLVERSPYCIHQIDTQGRLSAMNAAGLQMMGVEEECAIIGMPYLDAVAQPDRGRVAALMQAAYQGVSSEFEFEAANGRLFTSSFVPLFDDSKCVFALMGLTQDVTEQRQAARALQESQRRLDLALQGADLGIWDWDLRSGSLVLSERWLSLLGYRPGDIKAQWDSILDLVHPQDRQRFEERVADHLAGRSPRIESEHRMRAADGTWTWVLDRGMVVEKDGQDQPVRVTGTTLDVTERYCAEDRRRKLEARLQQAQKMDSVGQLAGGIAHDFSNLIQVVMGNLEIAGRALEQGNSPHDALADMAKATQRAAELTRRLLTFSRKQSVRPRALDMNELVAAMIGMLSRVMPENIGLEFQRWPTILPVVVDAGQVEQALLNLCVNARDAMPSGGRLSLVTSGATHDDGSPRARLEVVDTGCGMTDEVLQRAFEPFFSTKRPQGGTGLGLAMVYGISQQNGGTVAIDSQPSVGTRVIIDFPVTKEPISPSAEDEPASVKPAGGTVLVVEDEKMVCDLVARLLESEGYQVITAADGAGGVEAFRRRSDIDLVLMDAIMPNMDGHEAAAQMLSLNPDIKLLFTSGYHEQAVLPDEFLQRHGLQVLRKPYPVHELLARVREILAA